MGWIPSSGISGTSKTKNKKKKTMMMIMDQKQQQQPLKPLDQITEPTSERASSESSLRDNHGCKTRGVAEFNKSQTFPFRELAAATKNFKAECLLGEGGFGRAYKGHLESINQVKHFKKLLQKADNDSCTVYSVASSFVESLHPAYVSALKKLKETVESETFRKRKVALKSSRAEKVGNGEEKESMQK